MVCIPLDQREIQIKTNNGLERISVLDARYLQDIQFIQYNAFPIHEIDNSPIQKEWHQEIKILCLDLEDLLSLNHEKYWVQLIHDPTLHSMLTTFLQKAPRCWDIWAIPEKFVPIHNKLNRLVFYTLLRMSTDKESPENFLTLEGFAFTIYENFMFDIPKMIDICSLYGHPYGGNGILVNKMLTNIFTKQVSYVDDLKVVVGQLNDKVLANISEKFDGALTVIGLYDLLCYHYDTCMSLLCFFSTYPPAMNYFNPDKLITQFSALNSHLFKDIKVKLKKLTNAAQDLRSFKTLINRCQIASVKMVHCVLWRSCEMDLILDNSLSSDEHTRSAELFIGKLSLILDDVALMRRYYHECNLAKTFAMISNSHAEVAPEHFNYILNAIEIENSPSKDNKDIDQVHQSLSSSSAEDLIIPKVHPNIDSLITNIDNIFPQYNSGDFLSQCLSFYSYSSEEVIAALLENNLPPNLKTIKSRIDKEGPSFPGPSSTGPSSPPPGLSPPGLSKVATPTKPPVFKESLVSTRQNVFDNDEFDMFNNPHELNFDQIHIGKKDKQLQGDVNLTKHFITNNPKLAYEYDEYEDEYDDTYDGLVAATDTSLADEPAEFVIKPLNARLEQLNDSESNDSDQAGPSSDPGPRPGHHSPGPSGRSRGRARHTHQPRPRVDDKQGQKADGKVLQQRRRDNENKSSRGNHSRKRGADKKRRGGLIHM